jgi:hypothetical protein
MRLLGEPRSARPNHGWDLFDMIHYTCDACKRAIHSQETRFSVRIEVAASFDPMGDDEPEDDRDHLLEVHEMLERLESSADDEVGGLGVEELVEPFVERSFDLCPECARKFQRNPLGREAAKQFEFSQN